MTVAFTAAGCTVLLFCHLRLIIQLQHNHAFRAAATWAHILTGNTWGRNVAEAWNDTVEEWSGAADKERMTVVKLAMQDDAGSHMLQHMYIIHKWDIHAPVQCVYSFMNGTRSRCSTSRSCKAGTGGGHASDGPFLIDSLCIDFCSGPLWLQISHNPAFWSDL